MIHAAKRGAPELVRLLAKLGVDLTVTIGRALMNSGLKSKGPRMATR